MIGRQGRAKERRGKKGHSPAIGAGLPYFPRRLRTSVHGKPTDLSHSSPCSLGVYGTEANNLTALLR